MKRNKLLYSFAFLLLINTPLLAQKEQSEGVVWSSLRGLEYQLKAGFSIGGFSPIPLPVEIRSINKYQPTMSMSIEGVVIKSFNDSKWAIQTGLRLENKGMRTEATVKNYNMMIIGDGGEEISGVWTGDVRTNASVDYLSIPILVRYDLNKRWNVMAGPYFSYVLSGNFSGSVFDGYLRNGDPTGSKIEFTDGRSALYDFSNEIKTFQWGMQLGGEWRAFKHLNVYTDFTWGLDGLFNKSFETVTFKMYPIYLTIGFAYSF